MKLNFRSHGEGDHALLIAHGLLGSSANWQSLAKRFAQSRRVYTLEMRNHGQSPWSDTMSYEAMALDIADFAHSLNHSHISLLGHSMGGKAAMQLALDYPDAIDALIVADIAPVNYQHDHQHQIESMLGLDLHQLKNRAQADNALKSAIPETSIRAFLLHNLTFDANNKQWRWRPNLKVLLAAMDQLTNFSENQGKQYNQPTLFIHGEASDYLRPEHHSTIARLYPQTQYSEIEHAGHWLHAEQPKAFHAACEHFLSHAH